MADSFRGGVSGGGAGRADVRARVAVQGANLHALTGDEIFRIPLARCSLEREGGKILVRDEQSPLVIWSEDDDFLQVLERAQHGTLQDQVRRLRRAALGWRVLKGCVYAVVAACAAGAASLPVTRWAVRGGVPSVANGIGESALERLALPSGLAPGVERELGVIAERLRPATSPSIRSFRLLLADYAPVHSFNLPPATVIVTSGLVCEADGPDRVTAAVARELAHLEGRDVSQRVAEVTDWNTALDLARGDASKLRARMLDFASPKRSPGFTVDQETAANQRASAILMRAGVSLTAGQEPAGQERSPKPEATANGRDDPTAARDEANRVPGASDWSKVREEACDLVGR